MRLLLAMIAISLTSFYGCKTPNQNASEAKETWADVESYCDNWAREQAGRGFGWRIRYTRYYDQCLEQNANNGGGDNGGDNTSADSVLLVAINGRSSCRIPGFPDGLYMYNPLRHLAQDLKAQGTNSDTLHICLYATEGRISPDMMRIKAMYYKNRRQEVVGDALLRRNRIFVKDIPTLINKLAGGREAVIMGHSYGGWVALRTVLNNVDRSRRTLFNTKALYTIDPISPYDCNIARFIASEPGNQRSSCRQFPRDIEGNEIKRRTSLWVNFFQRQGKIASHQSRVGHDSYHFLDSEECAHRYLGANREVWRIIGTSLGDFLNRGGFEDSVLGRFESEPEAGTGGECGALTDSGARWSDPGTVSDRW